MYIPEALRNRVHYLRKSHRLQAPSAFVAVSALQDPVRSGVVAQDARHEDEDQRLTIHRREEGHGDEISQDIMGIRQAHVLVLHEGVVFQVRNILLPGASILHKLQKQRRALRSLRTLHSKVSTKHCTRTSCAEVSASPNAARNRTSFIFARKSGCFVDSSQPM